MCSGTGYDLLSSAGNRRLTYQLLIRRTWTAADTLGGHMVQHQWSEHVSKQSCTGIYLQTDVFWLKLARVGLHSAFLKAEEWLSGAQQWILWSSVCLQVDHNSKRKKTHKYEFKGYITDALTHRNGSNWRCFHIALIGWILKVAWQRHYTGSERGYTSVHGYWNHSGPAGAFLLLWCTASVWFHCPGIERKRRSYRPMRATLGTRLPERR